MFELKPSVFAVRDSYIIMVPSPSPTVMWVKVGDRCFYDDSNGILRSDTRVHRMTVPATVLDNARSYTVCAREMIERKPYFSKTGEVIEETFAFKPIEGDTFRAYHVSDTHNMIDEPVAAARAFGDVDLLVMNGDVPDHSGKIENFDNIYEIAWQITKGRIPAVFSRGNHDLRGIAAEKLADYTPTDNGRSYYTFRAGPVWGIVLDCGEDKRDDHPEYGNTICCREFRIRQTEFIKDVISRSESEYAESGVKYKLLIAHIPFTRDLVSLFQSEKETFIEWASLLKDHVKPHVFMAGHEHALSVDRVGGEQDFIGQPCTVVIGSNIRHAEDYYAGTGFEFSHDTVKVTFTSADGSIQGTDEFKIEK